MTMPLTLWLADEVQFKPKWTKLRFDPDHRALLLVAVRIIDIYICYFKKYWNHAKTFDRCLKI